MAVFVASRLDWSHKVIHKNMEDYDQIFAPVVKHSTFRMLLAIAVRNEMEVYHMDVKTAFLNATVDEVIFMKQPSEFAVEDKPNLVCQLKVYMT